MPIRRSNHDRSGIPQVGTVRGSICLKCDENTKKNCRVQGLSRRSALLYGDRDGKHRTADAFTDTLIVARGDVDERRGRDSSYHTRSAPTARSSVTVSRHCFLFFSFFLRIYIRRRGIIRKQTGAILLSGGRERNGLQL